MSLLTSTVKEKSDMILEPLQVMIQLSLLSNCPIGTKLSITNNILSIQMPTFFQGAVRWYNTDSMGDLYYLFHAIRRYYKWYKSKNTEIYNYILKRATIGLENLIQTYTELEKPTIAQTLTLYKNLLQMDEETIFKDSSNNNISIDNAFIGISDMYNKKILRIIYNGLQLIENENELEYLEGIIIMMKPIHRKIRTWISKNMTV